MNILLLWTTIILINYQEAYPSTFDKFCKTIMAHPLSIKRIGDRTELSEIIDLSPDERLLGIKQWKSPYKLLPINTDNNIDSTFLSTNRELELQEPIDSYVQDHYPDYYHYYQVKKIGHITSNWLKRSQSFHTPFSIVGKNIGIIAGHLGGQKSIKTTYSGGTFFDKDYKNLVDHYHQNKSYSFESIFSTSTSESISKGFITFNRASNKKAVLFEVTGVNHFWALNSSELEYYYPPGTLFKIISIEENKTLQARDIYGMPANRAISYTSVKMMEILSDISINKNTHEEKSILITGEIAEVAVDYHHPEKKIKALEKFLLLINKKFASNEPQGSLQIFRKKNYQIYALKSKTNELFFNFKDFTKAYQHPFRFALKETSPLVKEKNIHHDLFTLHASEIPIYISIILKKLALNLNNAKNNTNEKHRSIEIVAALSEFIYYYLGLIPFETHNLETINDFISILLELEKIQRKAWIMPDLSGLSSVEIYYYILSNMIVKKL